MEFFNSAIDVLQTLVIALGAGLGIWGVINLLEGYGNDNPGAKVKALSSSWRAAALPLSALSLYRFFPVCSDKITEGSLWRAYLTRLTNG